MLLSKGCLDEIHLNTRRLAKNQSGANSISCEHKLLQQRYHHRLGNGGSKLDNVQK